MRSSSTHGLSRWTMVLVCLSALTGCDSAELVFEPLSVQCMPYPSYPDRADPRPQVNVYLTMQVSNRAAETREVAAVDFVLRTESGPIAADRMSIDDEHSMAAGDNPLLALNRYDLADRQTAATVRPGQAVSCQLRFPAVIRLTPRGQDDRAKLLTRRKMIDLLTTSPTIEFGAGQTIDLGPLTTLPDPLPSRPSAYSDQVTLLEVPHGLNGFVVAAMEQRLRESNFGSEDLVALSLGGSIDGCFLEWWPPDPTHATSARLGFFQVAPRSDDERLARRLTRSPTAALMQTNSPAPTEAQTVARLLRDAGDLGAVTLWLESADPAARRAAIELLDHHQPSTGALLVQRLRDDPDTGVRQAVCRALTAVHVDPAGSLYPSLTTALRTASEDPDAALRRAAMNTACQHQCPQAVLPAARRLLAPGENLAPAVRVIQEARDRASLPQLLRIVVETGSDPAARALAELVEPSDLPVIRDALRGQITTRVALLQVLKRIGNEEDGAMLAAAWQEPVPEAFSSKALDAMGELGGEAALALLLQLSRDETERQWVRRRDALQALRRFRDDRALPIWESLATQSRFREPCIDGLAYHGGAAAIAALKRLARSEDPQLRRAADEALGW